jgi:helix-turn-helix protein
MAEQPTPLYVRLGADQTRRLASAVAASGKSKRQLIDDAVREHLTDEGLVIGRIALRDDGAEVLTAGEAAVLLRIDEAQLIEAAAQREVPGRLIAGEWRFARGALLAWLRGDAT